MSNQRAIDTYLQNLPSNIKSLYLSGERLEEFPDLSRFTELEELYCANNRLSRLPHNLCIMLPNLKVLACSGNNLTELPPLGDQLESLYCINNMLTRLPTLPASLKCLFCSFNRICELPDLPPNLKDLMCGDNILTNIPELPDTLKQLYCGNNLITHLPKIVDSLKVLSCFNNQIRVLPELPDSLTELICYENELTSIPCLGPNVEEIDFQDNPIYDVIHDAARCDEYDAHEYYNDDGVNPTKRNMIIHTVRIIHNFRKMYYLNKFKGKFRDLLWVKIREPQIREQYAPYKILNLLNEIGEDSEKFDRLFENM
jgi:Leucine-rich repeat (LRR) protein